MERHESKMLTGGRVVFHAGTEVFDFNVDTPSGSVELGAKK
jgi:hypothetical protein